MTDKRFIAGLELFNGADFFECHEVIEELWLETPAVDPLRDLYKGVIQAAAAIYQEERGIHSGANGLFRTAVGYLEKYSPESQGLDVERLVTDLKKYFASSDKRHFKLRYRSP